MVMAGDLLVAYRRPAEPCGACADTCSRMPCLSGREHSARQHGTAQRPPIRPFDITSDMLSVSNSPHPKGAGTLARRCLAQVQTGHRRDNQREAARHLTGALPEEVGPATSP
jgi:hypothetical protein